MTESIHRKVDPKCTFLFIDPPYFEKGPTLYVNALDAGNYTALAARLKAMSDTAWVLA